MYFTVSLHTQSKGVKGSIEQGAGKSRFDWQLCLKKKKPALIVSILLPSLESEADTVYLDYTSQYQNIKQSPWKVVCPTALTSPSSFSHLPRCPKGESKKNSPRSVHTKKLQCGHQGPALSSRGESKLTVLNARMVTLAVSRAARHGCRSKAFVFLSLPGMLLPLEGKEETWLERTETQMEPCQVSKLPSIILLHGYFSPPFRARSDNGHSQRQNKRPLDEAGQFVPLPFLE